MRRKACAHPLSTRVGLFLLAWCGLCLYFPFRLPTEEFVHRAEMDHHGEPDPHSSVPAVEDPLPSSHVSPGRTLEYCNTYGRFTNQVSTFSNSLEELVLRGHALMHSRS